MKMGLGQLDDTKPAFKRKFRFTFEGYDETGELLFPQTFVKPDGRPALTFNHPPIPIEETFRFYQSSSVLEEWMFKHKDQTFENYHKTEVGILCMYDGLGGLVEQWRFNVLSLGIDYCEWALPDWDEDDLYHYKLVYDKMNYSTTWQLPFMLENRHLLTEQASSS